MKLLISISLFFLSSVAFSAESNFNGTYSVSSYTWCNGPTQGVEAGCWPYGWQGIDLGKLSEVKIESLGNVSYLTLKDLSGKTWFSNFAICTSGQTSECNAEYLADAKTLVLKFGNVDNSMKIHIENKEISINVWSGAQSSYLVFEYSKN